MYSYRPTPTQTSSISRLLTVVPNGRRSAFSPFLGVVLGLILVVGLLAIRGITSVVYASQVKAIPTSEEEVYSLYAQKVTQATDPQKLAQVGTNLLSKDMARFAALSLKRASELDPNLRDAAYGWAFALLQAKKDTLTAEDLADVRLAIDRAEAVDPLYVPLLKLKLVVAQLEQNQAAVQETEARLKLFESPSITLSNP